MALADDIRTLRDGVLADLNAAHDYYADTRIAWDTVLRVVAGGDTFNVRNMTTGTVTTESDLALKAPRYIAKELAEATFQQFISIFESFFFDLLRFWLLAYPQNLIGKKVDFKAVLEAPDKDAITLLVVNRELNEVLYERPAGWFAYLEDRAKLGCPRPDEIERIAEAKASRDLLAHNRGVVTRTYEAKAGKLARYKEGQRMDIPEPYHREAWDLLQKVVADIANAAIAKFP
jgi:hypothetical protein